MKYFNMVPEDVDKAIEKLDDIGGPKSHSNYPWGWDGILRKKKQLF